MCERKVIPLTVTVDSGRCPQNHRCPAIGVCPTGAIVQQGYGLPAVDQDKCIGCRKCVRFCPMGALQAG